MIQHPTSDITRILKVQTVTDIYSTYVHNSIIPNSQKGDRIFSYGYLLKVMVTPGQENFSQYFKLMIASIAAKKKKKRS